jgi:hypothetical protein
MPQLQSLDNRGLSIKRWVTWTSPKYWEWIQVLAKLKQLNLKKIILLNLKLTKCIFRRCNLWKLSKELNMFWLLNDLCNVHQLFIVTSLQLLLPVIQTNFFFGAEISIRRNKNPQKLNVILLDQNRRNYYITTATPQKNYHFWSINTCRFHHKSKKPTFRNWF